MCEFCLPKLSRRRALGLAGAGTIATLLGRPDPAAAARSFQTEFGVNIEPRATWAGDDRPVLTTPPDEDVRFLLVHHTAGPSEGDPIRLIRDVYDFHTGPQKGWPDVAYNFFIEPGGRVFEARAGSLQRAVEASATGGSQGFAQLVCLLGDFTAHNPTDAQLSALNGTLSWLANRYGLDTSPGATASFVSRGSNKWAAGTQVTADIISGHREMSATDCPGDTFYPYLKDRVQREVQAVRAGGPNGGEPVTESTPVPVSTEAPVPASTAAPSTPTAPDPSTSTTSEAPTTLPSSTAAPVATGPVNVPPAPRVDEFAIDAPDTAQATSGRTSSNAAAWGLGAGAAAAVAAAAVYVGVRGSHDTGDKPAVDESAPRPPPEGGDPPQ